MAVGAVPAEGVGLSEARHGRLRAVLFAGIAVGLASAAALTLLKTQEGASAGYGQARARVETAMAQAAGMGYSPDDLATISTALRSQPSGTVPPFFGITNSYDQRRIAMLRLLDEVPRLELAALTIRRAVASSMLVQARGAMSAAHDKGADPAVLDPLVARLDVLASVLTTATTPGQIDLVQAELSSLVETASAAGASVTVEQAQLTQAADVLKTQMQGNLDRMRGAANAALAAARNDGTFAEMLKIAGTTTLIAKVEHYVTLLPSSDVNQVALGAAGAQAYQKRTHDLLLANLPSQIILISLAAQQLWAYQDGKIVQDTLVTTGRPALPTDIGAMKILSKNSPWRMRSPWPRGSPYWYPDSYVHKVVWFTVTGEGLHDAPWQSSMYGPGGQFTANASHGCIHVQMAAENFLYDWSKVGTAVVVYPGDGSPVSEQMKQVSVDARGVPFTGPKGA